MIHYQSIASEQLQYIQDQFNVYSGSFRKPTDDRYNKHMKLKQFHTSMVVREIGLLSSSLGMKAEEIAFTEAIAWLHDIGRFEQFDSYGTFADAESENHSEIGIRVIKKLNLLSSFTLEQQNLIIQAILHHNIPRVPANIDDTLGFYSRIIRDADKLDIWRVALGTNIFHKIQDEPLPCEYEVKPEFVACFRQEEIIPVDLAVSFYDSILLRLSWLFDLNFSHSLTEFRNRDIAGKFIRKLPHSADLEIVRNCISAYLDRGLRLSDAS